MTTHKISLRSVAGLAVAFVSVPLSIVLSYTQWDLLRYDAALALERVNAWPWFKGALILTTISFLVPFYVDWQERGDEPKVRTHLLLIGIHICAFGVLLMHPGTQGLGVWQDSSSMLPFVLVLICHMVAMRLVAADIRAASVQDKPKQR